MPNKGKEGGNAPTGTSGRQGNSSPGKNDNWQQDGDQTDRQTGEGPRRKNADDEDSPLGNRNTFR